MFKEFPTIKRLYNDYTKRYLKKILIALILSLVVAGSTSSIAWLLDPAIEKIFIEKDQTLILIIPILIVVAFSSKGLSLYFAKVTMIKVGENVKRDVQSDMIKNILKADTQVIDNRHSGGFINNLNNDVGMITNLISVVILNLFKDSLTLIGLLGVMFYQNWKLSIFAMIMIPLASIAAKSLGKRIGKVSTEAMERSEKLVTYLMEIFKNHKLMKIFQNEKYEETKAINRINDLMEKSAKIGTIFVRASPIMETLTGIMIAGLIYYSGKLILNDEININNFFSFLAAMMLAYQPVRSLATLNMSIRQGLSAAKRILPVIDEKNKIIENQDDKNLNFVNSDIVFNNIHFRYNNEEKEVLKSINLNFIGGKTTSLVGSSGAGKSTILNLIPRFYDRTLGDITIDNQSIYKSKISSLRKRISLVSQDTTLFDDSIRNNIAYANLEAKEDDIKKAAEMSFASDFIEKLPNKYDTVIGESGVRLSGGEKQRLSIARAMLKESSVILLDEATSSLDAETEDKIQKAITTLTKNKTTIVIAHRLSTVLNSDKIYVIESGKVVAEGTHKELLNSSSVYKNFYDKQISK